MKFITTFFAILILILLGYVFWLFVGYFKASTDDIKVSLMGAGGVVITALVSQYYIKKREIGTRQFLQKTEAYTPLFDLIFDVFTSKISGKDIEEKTIVAEMIKIKKSLVIWGNADVLNAWEQFERTSHCNDPYDTLSAVETVFKAIRKDLGHNDSTLKKGGLLALIIRDDEAEQEAFIADYEALMTGLNSDEMVVFSDAVHPTHQSRPAHGWFPKDQKTAIKVFSHRLDHSKMGCQCLHLWTATAPAFHGAGLHLCGSGSLCPAT